MTETPLFPALQPAQDRIAERLKRLESLATETGLDFAKIIGQRNPERFTEAEWEVLERRCSNPF